MRGKRGREMSRDKPPVNERLGFGDRMKLSLLATLILFILLGVSSLIPMSGREAEEMLEQAKQIIGEKITPIDIWLNNMVAALITYIPFIGVGIAGFIIFQTGRLFGALATLYGINSIMLILLAIATIYGLVEFIAYGTAFTESILLSYSIVKRSVRSEVKWLLVSMGIVALLLLAAALMESALITFLGGESGIEL